MQQLQTNFSDFGKTVEKQSGFLNQFKATAAGVFGGNIAFTGLNMLRGAFSSAIKDAQQYEVLLNKTKAVIASTGNVASISVKGLQDQASALESISAIDENVILNGENVIATFTNIRNVAGAGNDVFDQTTKAALDLSAALGQDMQSSAIQLGKALNDPIKGVSALQRVGVTFTAGQKAMIKSLVDSGNTLGAQKIILAEVNREFGGAAKAAGDTFAGAVFRAKDKVADFARNLITGLQPILLTIGKTIGDLYQNTLAPLFSFLMKNKEAVLAFAGAIATAYVAMKAWNVILEVSKAIQTAWAVTSTLMKGAELATIASTNGMAASMLRLNAVLRANPIGLIVTALALLAAGFVMAWNHSETFRKVVVKGLQIVLNAVGYLVGGISKLIGIFAKIPGMGWAKGIADGASKAANDIRKVSDGLDSLANKKISIPGFGGGSSASGTGKTGNAAAPNDGPSAAAGKAAAAAAKKQLAQLQSYQKEIATINKDIDKVNADAAFKRSQLDYEYGQKTAKINADFADKKLTIEKDYAKKTLEITNKVEQDRMNIIKKSKDLLISTFQNATKVDLAGLFKDSDATGVGLLQKLKEKFTGVKKLQENAGKLAAQGFSQSFIQEVVAQGPDAGNAMSDAILTATPDAISQMKDLYKGITDVSDTGMTALADSLFTGMGLANKELNDEMIATSLDLAKALSQNQTELSDALAANQKDLQDTLKQAQLDYQDSIRTLNLETQRQLDELVAKLQEVTALMLALSTMAGGGAAAGSTAKPKVTKGGGSVVSAQYLDTLSKFKAKEAADTAAWNLSITTNSNASSQQIAADVISGIKYGATVSGGYSGIPTTYTPAPTGRAGFDR